MDGLPHQRRAQHRLPLRRRHPAGSGQRERPRLPGERDTGQQTTPVTLDKA
jgi:hypothetical protein